MLIVADISMIFRSVRCLIRHLSMPSKKSVKTCRSCTSSTTIMLYWVRDGSVCICRNNTPSVRNKILVNLVRVFSNRTCQKWGLKLKIDMSEKKRLLTVWITFFLLFYRALLESIIWNMMSKYFYFNLSPADLKILTQK